MAAKQKNPANICQICLRYKNGPIGPYCSGHAKSGGGSGGGGSSDSLEQGGAGVSGTSGVQGRSSTLIPNSARPKKKKDNNKLLRLDNIDFDTDVISELLSDKRLIIKNDRESGVLTIKCLHHLLSDKQKDSLNQYMNALLNAFNQFTKENGIEGLVPQIKRDERGRIIGMVITLPGAKLYDQFIATLVANNLLPQQIVNQSNKTMYQPNKNYFSKTPFSTKPEPGARTKEHHDDHAPQDRKKNQGKLNPFDIHRGPKPKDL